MILVNESGKTENKSNFLFGTASEKKFFDFHDDFKGIIRRYVKSLVRIEQIPTGWTNYVFKAVTKDKKQYIFRFPRNDFFAQQLKHEVIFTYFVRDKVSIKTTDLQYKLHKGRGFSIHSFIEGHVLTDKYPIMSAVQKEQLAEDIAMYIKELQSIDLKKIDLELSSSFLKRLSRVNGGKFDYSLIETLAMFEKNLVIAHGDLNPGNIILDNDCRLLAVLDYAFATYSCSIQDLSRIIGRLPRDFRTPMLTKYKQIVNANLLESDIDKLIKMWNYVEMDYIEYMRRCHSDVVLPDL